MEHTQQIWQRVLARTEREESSPLGQLVFLSRESAEAYRRLLPNARGQRQRLLRQLLEEEEENLACLRGLGKLQGVAVPRKHCAVPRQPDGQELRRCAERSFCLLREYTARSAVGASGAVFRQMARRQEESCAHLAALLGIWEP